METLFRNHVRQDPTGGLRLGLSGHKCRFQPIVFVVGSLEDVYQAVIVALWNRIVLVAMTTSTFKRQAQNDTAKDFYLVADHLEPFGREVNDIRAGAIRSHAEEPSRHQVVDNLLGDDRYILVISQFIAGNLFQEKPIVWLVVVKRPDNVVAIAVSVRTDGIGTALPLGVGVSGRIEPVSAPAFAVSRGCQQAVNEPFVSVCCVVLKKWLDFVGLGRQSDQVEVHTP